MSITRLKQQKKSIIAAHARADNLKGFTQVLTTLGSIAALWIAAVWMAGVSYWLVAAATALMSLFLLRVFVLMHECGHGSLFRAARLNNAFGFVFGVVSAMPQYVWSQHHAFHHATNGNWAKYRGPLSIRSVEEYTAMTDAQRRRYRSERSIWLAPFAGFMYLIFNPRYTWFKGSIGLVGHVLKNKIAHPRIPIKTHAAGFKTPYWNDAAEYRHMFWNNVVLLCAWVAMSLVVDPLLFFAVYLTSLSLAGGAGIVIFTVQHNFEHSYASGNEGWCYDTAAIHGTSFLDLPRWLNWFTANIAYHHVHHLSSKIPNYRLVACHNEHRELFADVIRIRLGEVHRALKCILWDTRSQRIISVAEYQRQSRQLSVV
ncbi:MAG TPA: fatty acid desaturase [Burkholderiales bacterium]|nr:fatty acid desaturase [Burkholderiales bacterium]